MTGFLQVNERNTDDFEYGINMTLEYIDNWSLYLIIKILIKTFSQLLIKEILAHNLNAICKKLLMFRI